MALPSVKRGSVIFDYSIANFHPWSHLKNPLFYAIMVVIKIHLGLELAARARWR